MKIVSERPTASSSQQSTRMTVAFRYGSLVLTAVGIGWAVVFAAMGWWTVVALDFAIIVTGVATYLLTTRGQLSFGILVSQASFMLIAITMGLLLDVPTAEAPRVTHLYLLVVAALGYLNYQREKTRMQLALIAACLLTYVVLASAPLALPFVVPMPEMVRTIGTWANTIIATTMLAACFYAMRAEFTRQDKFTQDLMAALWRSEFELVYQPQVDSARAVIGAEALLRWNSPQHGRVSPAEFIPQAEKSGLMVPIGAWVIERGCQVLAAWNARSDLCHLTLSINVSASQLLDDDFESIVRKALAESGADPQRLILELTESVMVSEMDLIAAKLDSLHDLGITIALDDFGTGYSSLSYLRRLPIQQLKIDRGFVQDAVKTMRSASLVENVVRIGRDLGHDVLAEGVETMEQHALLAKAGCSQFQGYLYGKPMPLAEFERCVGGETLNGSSALFHANG